MLRIRRRRTIIKILSLSIGAFAAAVGLAVTGFWMSYSLRMNIEHSYERSLTDLSDHMDNINLALQKAQYAGTMSQLVGIAGEIRTESTAAKTALSQIAVSDVNFASTSKFIAQTGDYANSLSRTLSESRKLTDQDRKKISELSASSGKLSQQLGDIVSDVQLGRITLFKSERALDNLEKTKAQPVSSIKSGFQSIENNLSGLPSLIYDGPFSDNMLKKNPELTKGKAVVSRDTARKTAAQFFGLNINSMKDDGETAGNLPAYNFKSGTKSIAVSKSGGYVVRMIDSRAPKVQKFGAEVASAKAAAFLKSRNLGMMAQTYFLCANNICVINLASMQNGVTCYTDLMKVGIALDSGEVVSYDATGYIMNHKKRVFPKAGISADKAKSMLNPALTVKKTTLALIPRSGAGEALCYEFKCKAAGGKKDVIDYFNVTNGVEEQILILTKTPGGTLAM